MADLKFYGVDTLPVTLEPSAFYYVENGNYAESYLTDSNGEAKMIGNSLMIGQIVADELANWEGGGNTSSVLIVATIAERDQLAVDAESNLMVLVLDATGDPTVDMGSALYVYSLAADTWYKVAEYESMDLVLRWDLIDGRPVSTVAQIDDAVAKSHTHTNKTVLDKINVDVDGNMTYDGKSLKVQWISKNW